MINVLNVIIIKVIIWYMIRKVKIIYVNFVTMIRDIICKIFNVISVEMLFRAVLGVKMVNIV